MVDQNLRQLPASRAFPVGAFDKYSIMQYHFYDWMYVSGRQSPCYSEENLDLSPGDKNGINYMFPHDSSSIRSAFMEQKRLVKQILDLSNSTMNDQLHLQQHLMKIEDQ